MNFEYKVVPAPTRGKKAKGVKTSADRFAHALSSVMNELAAEGWEYLRTDTLPSEQRQGLTGRTTVFQNMLVFRRLVDAESLAEEAQSDAEATTETSGDEANAPRLAGVSREDRPNRAAPQLKPSEPRNDVAAE